MTSTWENTQAACDANSGERTILAGSENAARGFDFSEYVEIEAGQTILDDGSAEVTYILIDGAAGLELIIGTPSVVGNIVAVEITVPAKGNGNAEFEITFKATTNVGAVLVGCGTLLVPDGCSSSDNGCSC